MDSVNVLDLLHRPGPAITDSAAIVSADGEISYAQMWRQVAATAELLKDAGVAPGEHVGLHFPRSADYVVSLLAVLGVGAVAVPVDPEFPVERTVQILSASRPAVLLHSGQRPAELRDTGRWIDVSSLGVPVDGDDQMRVTQDRWHLGMPGTAPAVVLFTSGSTGLPKGVVLHHAGLLNRLRWGHEQYGLEETDRVLHKASMAFDASLHEILSPLIAGGTLVIAPPGLQFDSLGLVRLIQDAEITTAHFVPSMLRFVLDEPELAGCTALRRVFCGGEALDMKLVRRFQDALPSALFNQYGPTETSVSVTFWDCREPFDGDIAPIGRPIANAKCYVLGEDGGVVRSGETGELWIGGVPVGVGYLHAVEQTAQRFRPDPFAAGARMYRTGDLVRQAEAGFLEFRGRIDDQVKVRGIRVEPEEVSAVLRRHPMVHDAAVVAADGPDGTRLVGYVSARRAHAPVLDGLRRFTLPNGMAVAAPSSDEAAFLFRQIFEEDEYARFGVRVPDDGVVLDVGANIGLFSLWAHQQAARVRVIAVEPNPDALPYLRCNLEVHGVHAEVVDKAVTDRIGSAELTSFPELTYLSGLGADRSEAAAELVRSHYRHAPAAGSVTAAEAESLLDEASRRLTANRHRVHTTDLSSLLETYAIDRVDLLKINTEGAELEVLRGVRAEHWCRIRQVCLEVERASTVGAEIRKVLESNGFLLHEVSDWSVGADADVAYVYAFRPRTTEVVATRGTGLAGPVLTARHLHDFLSERLPPAMRPDQLIFMADLPRLPNGKVARLDLPAAPVRTAEAEDAPGAGLEDRLREIWRHALSVDVVRDDDNFVALGGHSLIALRVTVQARAISGCEVSPSSCLRSASFLDWAAAVQAG